MFTPNKRGVLCHSAWNCHSENNEIFYKTCAYNVIKKKIRPTTIPVLTEPSPDMARMCVWRPHQFSQGWEVAQTDVLGHVTGWRRIARMQLCRQLSKPIKKQIYPFPSVLSKTLGLSQFIHQSKYVSWIIIQLSSSLVLQFFKAHCTYSFDFRIFKKGL